MDALASIGDVSVTDRGFALQFTDAEFRSRQMAIYATPTDWYDYLSVLRGKDYDGGAQDVVDLLMHSPPSSKALVVTNDYQLLLVPYAP